MKIIEASIENIAQKIPKDVLEDVVSELEKQAKKLKLSKSKNQAVILLRADK